MNQEDSLFQLVNSTGYLAESGSVPPSGASLHLTEPT